MNIQQRRIELGKAMLLLAEAFDLNNINHSLQIEACMNYIVLTLKRLDFDYLFFEGLMNDCIKSQKETWKGVTAIDLEKGEL